MPFERPSLGTLTFTLTFDEELAKLTVRIIKAESLPQKGLIDPCDPFVQLRLHPFDNVFRTKTRRRTLNPVWNETFEFSKFPVDKLKQVVLRLEIIDFDAYSYDDFIGEIMIPLRDVAFPSPCRTLPFYEDIQKKSWRHLLGEIQLRLLLLTRRETDNLVVSVQQCRNLIAADVAGTSDPYVKVWLLYDWKKVEKRKTAIMRRKLNPIYNEDLIFTVSPEDLKKIRLLVIVMDYDFTSRNDMIGCVTIGRGADDDADDDVERSSTTSEQSSVDFLVRPDEEQWEDLIANPGEKRSPYWHFLQKDLPKELVDK